MEESQCAARTRRRRGSIRLDSIRERPAWNLFLIVLVYGSVLSVGVGFLPVPGLAEEQPQSETEPNDQRSSATTITVEDGGAEVNGVLGFGDEDWFAFQVSEGTRITVDYSGSSGEARLREPDGTVLEADSPTIDRLGATAASTGTYYLQLTTIASANGDYEFSVTLEGSGAPTTTASPTTTAPTTESTTTDSSDQPSTDSEVERSEYCDQARGQPVAPGNYSELLSPTDRDILFVNVSEGDFVTVNLTYRGPGGSGLAVYAPTSSVSFSALNGSQTSNIPNYRGQDIDRNVEMRQDGFVEARFFFVEPGNTQFRVYAEGDGVCLAFHTVDLNDPNTGFDGSAEGGAGTWSLSFGVNEAESRTIEPTEPPAGAQLDALRDRIERLEARIETLERRVSELENGTNATTGNNSTSARPAGVPAGWSLELVGSDSSRVASSATAVRSREAVPAEARPWRRAG